MIIPNENGDSTLEARIRVTWLLSLRSLVTHRGIR